MTEPVIHHADRPPFVPADWYDYIFDHGELGDYLWTTLRIGEERHRCLLLVVPYHGKKGQLGKLVERGLELIQIFPSHADNNWAQPGPINGWDGNVDKPTFSPSIFIRGSTDDPGWHGFFKAGKIQTV